MKKKCIVLSAIIALLSAVTMSHAGLVGDVNGDGVINLGDGIMSIQAMSGFDNNPVIINDVNKDSKIGSEEAIYTFQTIAQIRNYLEKKWKTDQVFETPESVLYDPVNHVLYVSNIKGGPMEMDGNGYISKLSVEGQVITQKWVQGLNAPKGMGIKGNRLYVSDINQLVEIDISNGTILNRFDAQGATFLNDVAVDTASGIVYVTDSSSNAIFALNNGTFAQWMQDNTQLDGVNGMVVKGNQLIVGTCGFIKSITIADKTITNLASTFNDCVDGIVIDTDGNFLVSNWDGRIYAIDANFNTIKLMDTQTENIQTADIGYFPNEKLLLIPTFGDNRVVAYQYRTKPNDGNLSAKVKTTRDDKGVWFISGSENAALFNIFEAMGYAVAQDRLWQMEKFRRAARGTLAEIFGAGDNNQFLTQDIYMRTIGYSDQELKDAYERLDDETRTMINGYLAGVNRRIAEVKANPDILPYEFKAIGVRLQINFVPSDWTYHDLLAWTALFQRNFDPEAIGGASPVQIQNAALYQTLITKFPLDGAKMFADLRVINDPDALTYIPIYPGRRGSNPAEMTIPTYENVPDIREAVDNITQTLDTVTETLKKINAFVKMGSYAWTVAGTKTASGNPILYSGPQMGFSVPSIIMEGSIRAGGLEVSGMALPGSPGIFIGRTPHHAWSAQVGHAHTTDYYLEPSTAVDARSPHRIEVIKVAGSNNITLPVYRTAHGPVINPMPFDPTKVSATNPIISWKYAHWNYELGANKALMMFAKAKNMDEFGAAMPYIGVSMHFCYADKDGNIAYWMSGRDPVRPLGEWRLPQGFIPTATPLEWDANTIKSFVNDRNTPQGYYAGWNNKAVATYDSGYNTFSYMFGPFHRAHVIDEYLTSHNQLTFEQVRDLALNIAATDSFGYGGNPWKFVETYFKDAIGREERTETYKAELDLLDAWDGHMVDGGQEGWASNTIRSDAWVLMDQWIKESIRLTFADELGDLYSKEPYQNLFNIMIRAFKGNQSAVKPNYNWFQNKTDHNAPQTADKIIVAALQKTLNDLGTRPWNKARGTIPYNHDILGKVHEMPFASRSTYGQCIEFNSNGPVRIESFFPLGESGNILMQSNFSPEFDSNFFSMAPLYDSFKYRNFPLFQ